VTACLKEGDDEGGRGGVLLEELEGDVLVVFVWEIAERRRLEEHFGGRVGREEGSRRSGIK
jgi:hypothetical protein